MNISSIGSSSPYSISSSNLFSTATNSTQQSGLLGSLNLSSSQEQQISQILQNANTQGLSAQQTFSQINSVLTPAQQAQLQQETQGHHHHHHGGGDGASQLLSSNSDQTDAFGIPTNLSFTQGSQAISDIAASFSFQSQNQQNEL